VCIGCWLVCILDIAQSRADVMSDARCLVQACACLPVPRLYVPPTTLNSCCWSAASCSGTAARFTTPKTRQDPAFMFCSCYCLCDLVSLQHQEHCTGQHSPAPVCQQPTLNTSSRERANVIMENGPDRAFEISGAPRGCKQEADAHEGQSASVGSLTRH
jgi:hypothetical protein